MKGFRKQIQEVFYWRDSWGTPGEISGKSSGETPRERFAGFIGGTPWEALEETPGECVR